jgi:hypothetical protein
VQVLRDPAAYRPLGRAAEEKVKLMYSLEAVIPQMLKMYELVANQPAFAPPACDVGYPDNRAASRAGG